MAGGDDLIDKGRPVVRPFLLENGDEDEIQLVEKGLLGSQGFFGTGALENEINNEVADT